MQGSSVGEFLHARELHAGPPMTGQPEQCLEAGLLGTGRRIRAPAVVDQYPHRTALDQAEQFDELVFAHLDLGEQAKFGKLAEQRPDVLQARHAIHCRVEGHTDHALLTQRGQLLEADVTIDYRYALETPLTAGQGMQQAAVVSVVATVGPHQQGMTHAIGIHHLVELLQRRDLLTGWRVRRIGVVSEACRVKQMVMAIDLRFIKDVQKRFLQAPLRLPADLVIVRHQGRFAWVHDTAGVAIALIHRWRRP
ncbi:hypothetical protein D3C79_760180 [compost metagenome]